MVEAQELKDFIRNIPDFPKKGIIFRDITTLFKNKTAFSTAIDRLYRPFENTPLDLVAGIEARGFLLAGVLGYKLGLGVIPIRKLNKLPAPTLQIQYNLEYGQDGLEIHRDAIQPGQAVLIVDDLMATGGSAAAACNLVEQLGGKIAGLAFLIELSFLKGRERLAQYDIFSLITYDQE